MIRRLLATLGLAALSSGVWAGEALTVRSDALAQTVEDLAQAPVVNRSGLVVRVAEVASVDVTP